MLSAASAARVTQSAPAIAFFDLDKTLIARNSGALWLKSEFKKGNVGYRQALRAYSWLARYSLGFARLEEALEESIATLTGAEEAIVRERSFDFYAREVRGLFRPGARAALDAHRHQGDRLVLLTSSSLYLAEAVMADLELDDILCNRFEVDGAGRYTGRSLGPLCYGPGKVELARGYVARLGIDLAACSFYSDSASDVPMLEAVGSPVCVNPDPRLRSIARSRGWRVEDWGEPAAVRAATP